MKQCSRRYNSIFVP